MATDRENQPDNTDQPLDERNSGITEFVMQKDPNMNYDVVIFEDCQRCMQFKPNYVKYTDFKHCSFDLEYIDKEVIQTFECFKCSFTWTRKYYYE